jgi:hypothetical protein
MAEDDIELLRLRARAKQKAEQEMMAQEAAIPAEVAQPEEVGMLEKANRFLNLPSGASRAAIAGAIEPLVGKDIVSAQEVTTGTVPDIYELSKRADFDLLNLTPGFVRNLAKLTGQEELVRKGVGMIGDVYTDPATYLAAPLKAVQVAGKVGPKALAAAKFGEVLLNPIGESIGAGGKATAGLGSKIYKSAFEKADRALATRYGKGSIADILKSKNFAGSAEEALAKTQQINQELGSKIGDYRVAADMSGVLESPKGLETAEKIVQKYRVASDPKMMAIADNLQEVLDSYKTMPPKTASELATIKRTNLDMAGGDSAFNLLKSSPDRAESELRKAIAKSLAEAEDTAVKKALSPEEFADYLATKKDYGVTTKFSQKEMSKLASQEANRTGILPSDVDVMGTGAALASGSPIALGAMALKKAKNIARLTSSKTGGGLMLENLGAKMQTATQVPPQIWMEMIRTQNKESEK